MAALETSDQSRIGVIDTCMVTRRVIRLCNQGIMPEKETDAMTVSWGIVLAAYCLVAYDTFQRPQDRVLAPMIRRAVASIFMVSYTVVVVAVVWMAVEIMTSIW